MKLNKKFYLITLINKEPHYSIDYIGKNKIGELMFKAHKNCNMLFNKKKQAQHFLVGLKKLAEESQRVK